MSTTNRKTRQMAVAAMLAALYAAVSLMLPMLSYGPVQIRFSEALTLLAVFSPAAVWGVSLGCLLTNAIGVALGVTMPPDILFGTLATLLAALLTYRLRGVRTRGLPLVAALPPVLVNAVIIGAEVTLFFFAPGEQTAAIFAANMLSVGAGQIVPCLVLGVALVALLERAGLSQKLFENI